MSEKNYLPKLPQGGGERVKILSPQGPGIELGTYRILGKSLQLQAMGVV